MPSVRHDRPSSFCNRNRMKSRLSRISLQSLEDRLAPADWSGTIPNGTEWKSNETQNVIGHIDVPAGSTLTIQPGTVIKFNTGLAMNVEGTVTAPGTAANPITFTSYRDGAGAVAGDWNAIYFNAGSGNSVLDHVNVKYGGYSFAFGPLDGEVLLSAPIKLTNSTISNASKGGLRINNSNPDLTNLKVQNSASFAIAMTADSQPILASPILTGNTINAVLVDGGNFGGSAKWDNPAVPYQMRDHFTLGSAGTLEIGAGQTIRMQTGLAFSIDGKITAKGTAADPITFTSYRDGAGALPGDWNGLYLNSGSAGSELDHVNVRYGGYSFAFGTLDAEVFIYAPISFTNSTVSDAIKGGLRIINCNPDLTNLTVQNNPNLAIGMTPDSQPNLTSANLTGNGTNAVIVDGGTFSGVGKWNNPEVPYQLNNSLTIGSAGTLEIGAGQTIRLASGVYLETDGKITARGTADKPITFTSYRDGAGAAPGDWNALYLNAGSVGSELDHVNVRYGGYSFGQGTLQGQVFIAAPISLTNSTVSNALNGGVRITNSSPTLTNTKILNSPGNAVSMNLASSILGTGLSAAGNLYNAVVVDGGTMSADSSWGGGLPYLLYGSVTINSSATLTLPAETILDATEASWFYGTGNITNAGLIRKMSGTGTSAIQPKITNTGTIRVQSGRLNLGSITNNGDGIVVGSYGTTVGVSGNWDGDSQNAVALAPLSTVNFNGSGTAVNPQLLEAMSTDKGNSPEAFADNFAFQAITLSNSTYVKLQDVANNTTASGAEAVYARYLTVPSGTTLDLNNLKLYTQSATIGGTIKNGSVTVLPDGGPIKRDTATPGKISVVGEIDDWTIFARKSEALTITLAPGSGSPTAPPSPILNYGDVTLFDPDGNQLATGKNTTAGAEILLNGIALPKDGIYHIKVKAPTTQANSTGNYVLGAWDSTLTVRSLELGKTVTGKVEKPFTVDRYTFTATAGNVVDFRLVAAETSAIQFDLVGPGGYTAFTNQSADVELITLPSDGVYTLVAHGSQRQTGAYAARIDLVTINDLTLGTPRTDNLGGGAQTHLYRVNVPEAKHLQVSLQDPDSNHRNEVYVRFGSAPTRRDYQYKFTTPASASQLVSVPMAAPGDWYILVYTESAATPGDYSIRADVAEVFVNHVTPDHAGNAVDQVLTLTGLGFDSTATVSLVSATNTVYPATTSSVDLPTQITATFAAGTIPAGVYSIKVTTATGSATLTNGFRSIQGGAAKLETSVAVPNPIGFHIASTIYVQYSNSGDVPMPAPLLALTAVMSGQRGALLTLDKSLVTSGFWTSATPVGYSQEVQILASGATPGLLQPGESVRVPVYYAGWLRDQWDGNRPPINFVLGTTTTDNTTPIDWGAMSSSLRPQHISESAWPTVFSNLVARLGSTWGQLIQRFSSDAAYMGRLGENVTDIPRLFDFEIERANGLNPMTELDQDVDLQLAAPGTPLVIARSFGSTIQDRHRVGPFGHGWTLMGGWDRTLTIHADGTVAVATGDGGERLFQPDSRQTGKYIAMTGDFGTLKYLGNGVYAITELNGVVTGFKDGRVSFTEDNNGNRVNGTYTAGLLTRLSTASNQAIDINYNAAGRITNLTSSLGPRTLYTYDSTNLYLVSVTKFQSAFDGVGYTTQYAYDTLVGTAKTHALLSIIDEKGVQENFAYDERGRLSSMSMTSGATPIQYANGDDGTVSVKDALNGVTTYSYLDHGLVAKTVDPLGNATNYDFDEKGILTGMTDALGQTHTFAYNSHRGLTQVTNPLGQTLKNSYTEFDRLASATDARENSTTYKYDAKGNLISTTHADGTIEQLAYDPLGQITASTNRRGQAVTFTYNSAGHVLSKSYPDGYEATYVYDSRENLTSATDTDGITTLAYDDMNRLTQITYPGGRFLKYTYDSAGRRSQMTDQAGNVLNYSYDNLSRLQRLKDGANKTLVVYSYDSAGRLSRQDNENGTYATYDYDLAGRLLHLVHHTSGGAVSSQFDYTYDRLGRRVSQTTNNGNWTYEYDGIGQLTHTVFDSTSPEIADQEESYTYDAAGNRMQANKNGVVTQYVANNLNQYTTVGASNYSYDADGNLVAQSDASGTTTYSYNPENRLTSVDGPAGEWSYLYDPFRNRVATTHGGSTIFNVIDPAGMGDVVGQYDSANALQSRFVHGNGLVSLTTAGNETLYIDDDGRGNVTKLTDASGDLVNLYDYGPFGNSLRRVEVAPNPFQFGGKFGVMNESNGLQFMRARFYDTADGRFISADPKGISSGDINIYRYASNAPLDFVDPSGMTTYLPNGNIAISEEEWNAEVKKMLKQLEDYDAKHPWSWDKWSYKNQAGKFDSQWFNSVTYEIQGGPLKGKVMMGHQLNYYFQGMIAKHYGVWENDMYIIIYTWKFVNYGVLPSDEALLAASSGYNTSPVTSYDPNDLIGPAGYGSANFVRGDLGILPYRINFENDATASAPAQRVTVSNPLSSNFDYDTFTLSEIGFGDTLVDIPADAQHFETTVSMTYNDKAFDVFIEAGLDSATGEVFAIFQSLDPTTMLPPDALTGFLPPEDGTGRGQGHISYTIKPKANLASGTEIRNVALIVFDGNPSIATDQVDPHDPAAGRDPNKQALITIDAGTPTSSMPALPATMNSASINLSWPGQDEANGSGIVGYDVYVSDNGGAYSPYLTNTLLTSTKYWALPGHLYSFYAVAIDGVGHRQSIYTPVSTTISAANPGSKQTFTDDDGDVYTLSLKGPGQMKFLPDDADADGKGPIGLMLLSGTDPAKSSLSVTVKKAKTGDGRVSIGAIEGTGLKAITAAGSDLLAHIKLTGPLGGLTARDIKAGSLVQATGSAMQQTPIAAHVVEDGVTIDLGTSIKSFKAASVGNGSIKTPSISSLAIKGDAKNKPAAIPGDFNADLTLSGTGDPKKPTLGSATIAGSVNSSDWDVTGKIGSLNINGNITGWNLDETGDVRKLQIGTVADATVEVSGAIASVKAKQWDAGQLTAGSIGTFAINGNFGANLTVTGIGVAAGKPALTTATVSGSVNGSVISVTGTVNAFTAGAFVNSSLWTGFTPTDPTNPFAGGAFAPGSNLNNFRVTGIKGSMDPAFANSVVAADSMGSVKIKSVATINGGDAFGLLAHTAIKKLAISTPALSLKDVTADPSLVGFDDFSVHFA